MNPKVEIKSFVIFKSLAYNLTKEGQKEERLRRLKGLLGTIIGNNAIVSVGFVVTKDEANTMLGGNPAKLIKLIE
ncbi:MAG TPA: hypothetical protein VIM42_12185 [Clostridium sp.]